MRARTRLVLSLVALSLGSYACDDGSDDEDTTMDPVTGADASFAPGDSGASTGGGRPTFFGGGDGGRGAFFGGGDGGRGTFFGGGDGGRGAFFGGGGTREAGAGLGARDAGSLGSRDAGRGSSTGGGSFTGGGSASGGGSFTGGGGTTGGGSVTSDAGF